MNNNKFILSYDIGTSSAKSAIVTLDGKIVEKHCIFYDISTPKPGWVEQNPDLWWSAICESSRELLSRSSLSKEHIIAVGFATQIQGTIPVDLAGKYLMPCLHSMDGRAQAIAQKILRGIINIEGYGITKALRWIWAMGGAPKLSGKDPVFKILWIKKHAPEIWNKTYKFLDIKDYILFLATGKMVATYDVGHASWLMGIRKNNPRWEKSYLKKLKIPIDKLPDLISSTQVIGTLTEKAASEMGISKEAKVISGCADMSAAMIGSGSMKQSEPHVYVGSSAWITTHVKRHYANIFYYIATLYGGHPSKFMLTAPQENGGYVLKWAKDHIFLGKSYEEIDTLVESVQAKENDIFFMPWIIGEATPLNDDYLRACFVNISITSQESHLARAIYEGIAFNLKWALEGVEKIISQKASCLRFAGGGAKSNIWCQIISDITGRKVYQIETPEYSGVKGIALMTSFVLGFIERFEDIEKHISVSNIYEPNPDYKLFYEEKFHLYKAFLKIIEHGLKRQTV